MKKIFTFLSGALAALLLSSAPVVATATSVIHRGIDGYYFQNTNKLLKTPQSQIVVTIVRHPSYKDLNKHFGEKSPPGFTTRAYTTWTPDGTHCTIHMVDPSIDYQPQYIGHEFIHCMYGDFHPSQDAPLKG
jgi:hypothetical protein